MAHGPQVAHLCLRSHPDNVSSLKNNRHFLMFLPLYLNLLFPYSLCWTSCPFGPVPITIPGASRRLSSLKQHRTCLMLGCCGFSEGSLRRLSPACHEAAVCLHSILLKHGVLFRQPGNHVCLHSLACLSSASSLPI